MKTIQVYDPARCCSSGVCGPEVDPKLIQPVPAAEQASACCGDADAESPAGGDRCCG